jgi:hypothetical protein
MSNQNFEAPALLRTSWRIASMPAVELCKHIWTNPSRSVHPGSPPGETTSPMRRGGHGGLFQYPTILPPMPRTPAASTEQHTQTCKLLPACYGLQQNAKMPTSSSLQHLNAARSSAHGACPQSCTRSTGISCKLARVTLARYSLVHR